MLERRFDGGKFNRAWVADITDLYTVEDWLYRAVVMDLASHRIVGWSMSDRMHAELVCQALQAACRRRKPAPGLIMHSHRGRQYARDRYRRLINEFRMLLRYETRAQARLDVVDWIEDFYNHRRLHSSIGYRTTAHLESGLMAA